MFCQLPSKLSLQNVWGYPSDSAGPRAPDGWKLFVESPGQKTSTLLSSWMPASSGDPKFYTVPFPLLIQRWPWSLHQALVSQGGDFTPAEIPAGASPVSAVSFSLGTRTALLTLGLMSFAMLSFPFGFMEIRQAGSLLRPLQDVLPIDLWHIAMQLLHIFLVHFDYQGLMDIQPGSPGLSFNIPLPEVSTWFLWIAGTFRQVWFLPQKRGQGSWTSAEITKILWATERTRGCCRQ